MQPEQIRYTKSGKLIVPGASATDNTSKNPMDKRVSNKGAGPRAQRRTGVRGDR